jgi:hypothetical protein
MVLKLTKLAVYGEWGLGRGCRQPWRSRRCGLPLTPLDHPWLISRHPLFVQSALTSPDLVLLSLQGMRRAR